MTKLSLVYYETVQHPYEQIKRTVTGSKNKCECWFAIFIHLARELPLQFNAWFFFVWLFFVVFSGRDCVTI